MSNFLFLSYCFAVGFYCGLPKFNKDFTSNKYAWFACSCIGLIFGVALTLTVAIWPLVPIYKFVRMLIVTWLFRYRYYNPFVSITKA